MEMQSLLSLTFCQASISPALVKLCPTSGHASASVDPSYPIDNVTLWRISMMVWPVPCKHTCVPSSPVLAEGEDAAPVLEVAAEEAGDEPVAVLLGVAGGDVDGALGPCGVPPALAGGWGSCGSFDDMQHVANASHASKHHKNADGKPIRSCNQMTG